MFDIYLTDRAVPESDGYAVYGTVILNDYSETFVASLVDWSPVDYRRQWGKASQRLFEGYDRSALVASYVRPPDSEFLMWWLMYREGEVVHVRNELLPYSQLATPFSIDDPWSSIRDRTVRTEDGFEISEWDVPIEEFSKFIERCKTKAF